MKQSIIFLLIVLNQNYFCQGIANITTPKDSICLGEEIILSSSTSTSNSPIVRSLWNITGPNSYNYIDSTLPGLDLTINNITSPGSYSVALINQHQNGTATVDQEINFLFVYDIDVSFTDILQGSVEVENHFVYCPPIVGNFTNTSTSIFPLQSFEWQFNNQNLAFNQQINTSENPNGIQFLYPGNIDLNLIVTDSNQCTDTVFIQNYLEILGPIAECHYSQTGNSNFMEYNFSVTNIENVASLEWNLGNGEIINDLDGFTYTYSTGGIYNAYVEAIDFNGCQVIYNLGEIIPGINSIEKHFYENFKFYPNPSSDFVTFENKFDSPIKIQDLNGKEISSEVYKIFENKIDVSNLNSGIYFLISGEKSYKFIKN